jgi:alpha-mannosidase
MENEYYRIDLKNNGIRRIIDKEIGKDILKADRFGGGDVFTMQSVGNGAGEFADVQQPTMEGFERLSDLMSPWVRVEQGPVRITYETAGTFGDATVRLRVRLYNGIKRIDFETDILGFNGAKYREFRMAFPLNMEKGEIAYSVPMGVVEVGKSEIAGAAGERYVEPCAEVHPREVIDWFSASNGDFGVTISSSVAVFDWIDPTGATVDYPVLQPLLLASRKSCHAEGNWYLQTGDHTFNFSLYSYKGSWKNGWKKGTEASQPLIAVTGASGQSEKTLPESMSFCSVDADNVFISTIKKCDDDDSVVIRCCELEGRDARHPEFCSAKSGDPAQIGITWFTGIAKADRTNIIEEEGRPIGHSGNTLQARIGHHAIETFKITPALK